MISKSMVILLSAVLALSIQPVAVADEAARFEIGLRGNVLLGDGVPANDVLGLGVIARYRLNNGWFVGAGIDAYEYDFEHPAKLVGLRQDPDLSDIDADASSTVLSASFGRLYNATDDGFDWFWSLGLGFASPSVDDVAGPTDTGGMFDITFDVGSEVHLMGTLGSSYNFSSKWSASFAARLEHHFMDVLATDRGTGNTFKVDSQSPIGAYFSLNYKF